MAKIHDASEDHPYLRGTLNVLRKQTHALLEDGRKIQSHYRKLDKEYSDWEERLNNLDKAISELESQTGLTPKKLHTEIAIPQLERKEETTTNLLDDLFDI